MIVTQVMPAKVKSFGLALMVAGMVVVSLTACGGDATPTPQTSAPTTGAVNNSNPAPSGGNIPKKAGQSVGVKLAEWSILPNNLSIPSGNITFVVDNAGSFTHNLAVQDSKGATIGTTPNFKQADGQKTFTAQLAPGTYTLICTIPGHADKGMKGTLTVGP